MRIDEPCLGGRTWLVADSWPIAYAIGIVGQEGEELFAHDVKAAAV